MKKLFFVSAACLLAGIASAQVSDSVAVANDSVVQATAVQPPPQRRDTRSFKDRVDFGFGSSFWINTRVLYAEAAPSLAYRFPKRLVTGVGYRYIYQHERLLNNDLHAYGPNLFARLDLLRRVYLWTEYEHLNSQYFDQQFGSDNYTRQDQGVDSWFAGLGYVRTVGKRGRGGISFQVLYNFLYDDYSNNPYYSPVTYRVGYFF